MANSAWLCDYIRHTVRSERDAVTIEVEYKEGEAAGWFVKKVETDNDAAKKLLTDGIVAEGLARYVECYNRFKAREQGILAATRYRRMGYELWIEVGGFEQEIETSCETEQEARELFVATLHAYAEKYGMAEGILARIGFRGHNKVSMVIADLIIEPELAGISGRFDTRRP